MIEAPDYRLQPGSPAIDAGTSVGAPVVDIEGPPRPFGAGIDIGVNCNGFYTHLVACPDYPDCYLAAIRYENLFYPSTGYCGLPPVRFLRSRLYIDLARLNVKPHQI